MALGFLNKKENNSEETVIEDDFVELDAKTTNENKKVVVRAETLREFDDVEDVQNRLRDNQIVWVNIKPLKQKDMSKLKRAVKRLKKTVRSVDGDIAGVDEDWIVITPSYAEIERTGDEISDK
ncbi:MAG: cell division protein SepF [Candidatus Nanohaloarchaea archaeon]